MCVVSMVSDHYIDKWKNREQFSYIPSSIIGGWEKYEPAATKEDIEDIRKELNELRELLKRAIKYDEQNNQPKCNNSEKVEILKKIAEAFGVDIPELKNL